MRRSDWDQPTRRRALGSMMAAPLAACTHSLPASPGLPVSREGFVGIGGIEQFIAIRGRDDKNPALLFLHGGPGNAMSPFLSVFAPWEDHFTVVNWDQRGSGRTFGRNRGDPADLTPQRLAADAIEVAGHVRKVLNKDRLILCGHSMGAVLGWRAVQTRPDLFHAFVGTGMLINYERTLRLQEAYARAQAEAAGDAAAIDAMTQAQRLPVDDIRRPRPIRRWLMSKQDLAYLQTVQQPFVEQAARSAEARAWVDGQRQTTAAGSAILASMLHYDIAREGMTAQVPVSVIQGREDWTTPMQLARDFVDALAAPSKSFTAIDGGHFACFTNPQAFVPALRAVKEGIGREPDAS